MLSYRRARRGRVAATAMSARGRMWQFVSREVLGDSPVRSPKGNRNMKRQNRALKKLGLENSVVTYDHHG